MSVFVPYKSPHDWRKGWQRLVTLPESERMRTGYILSHVISGTLNEQYLLLPIKNARVGSFKIPGFMFIMHLVSPSHDLHDLVNCGKAGLFMGVLLWLTVKKKRTKWVWLWHGSLCAGGMGACAWVWGCANACVCTVNYCKTVQICTEFPCHRSEEKTLPDYFKGFMRQWVCWLLRDAGMEEMPRVREKAIICLG